MFETIWTIITALLSISFVLISIALVHEFGHYITAKLTGIWVLEFAIGFGNRLLKIKWGETLYSLRPFPLGGFVRLAGMDNSEEEDEKDESQTEAEEKKDQDEKENKDDLESEKPSESNNKEQDKSESEPKEKSEKKQVIDDELPVVPKDHPRSYLTKNPLAKITVLSAGSIMNMVWAVFLFVFIYLLAGGPVSNIAVVDAMEGRPAEAAGVMKGDIITAIDSVELTEWTQGIQLIQAAGGQEITLSVLRKNPQQRPAVAGGVLRDDLAVNNHSYTVHRQEKVEINVVPEGEPGAGQIGISLAPNQYAFRQLSVTESVRRGLSEGITIIVQTLSGLYRMVSGRTQADVAGPVKIMQMIQERSSQGLVDLLYLTAILSINIGLINLLPLPVLDGGRIVFLFLEVIFCLINKVSGLKLAITPKVEEGIHFAGMLFLLSLLLFVTYRDIMSFF